MFLSAFFEVEEYLEGMVDNKQKLYKVNAIYYFNKESPFVYCMLLVNNTDTTILKYCC